MYLQKNIQGNIDLICLFENATKIVYISTSSIQVFDKRHKNIVYFASGPASTPNSFFTSSVKSKIAFV